MSADDRRFRCGVSFGLRLLLSRLFYPGAIQSIAIQPIVTQSIVIFLNDEGGGQ